MVMLEDKGTTTKTNYEKVTAAVVSEIPTPIVETTPSSLLL